MLKRDPTAWRDMQRNQKAAATQSAAVNFRTPVTSNPSLPQDSTSDHTKKRKRPATETDEIDLLFSKVSHMGKSALSTADSAPVKEAVDDSTPAEKGMDKSVSDAELKEVLGAIKKVSKKEGMRKSRRV